MNDYLLITAARNEGRHIDDTLHSVAAQSRPPLRWMIVDDGSSDDTAARVENFARGRPWVELLRVPGQGARSFAGKARSFNEALRRLSSVPAAFVGNLDADITIPPGFYEFLTARLAEDATLGIVGAPFVEEGRTYDYRFSSLRHVSGACQFFRRQCLEQIGGYTPIEGGGIDVAAVLAARLHGWNTRTFTEVTCQHHRPMNTAGRRSRLAGSYQLGQRAYRMGYHPLWQVLRSVYQMTRPPYLGGGVALLAGFLVATLHARPRPLTSEMVRLQRTDQMRRLRRILTGRRGAA